mgnify:CR=1 FL=1
MASMVTTGGILADIGTDHAYVPIALVQRQKIKGAIAMDINEGPLARAQEHIRAARLEEYIQTRLSDGAEALLPNEADSILIAGMGGELILHILTEGESVCSTAKELICSHSLKYIRSGNICASISIKLKMKIWSVKKENIIR